MLAEHPAWRRSRWSGRPTRCSARSACAFVVAEPGAGTGSLDRDALRGWCRDRIADYKAPDRVVVVDDAPGDPDAQDRQARAATHASTTEALPSVPREGADCTVNASESRYQRPTSRETTPDPARRRSLFTMVEPHKGHEVAYNRWYERDHFYAGCMIGAWQFAGTPVRRDARRARRSATPPTRRSRPTRRRARTSPSTGSSPGNFGEWIQWGTEQVNWLHANDRMFPTATTSTRRCTSTAARPTHRAATCRPSSRSTTRYPGLVVVIGELADGVDADAGDRVAPRPPAARPTSPSSARPSRCGTTAGRRARHAGRRPRPASSGSSTTTRSRSGTRPVRRARRRRSPTRGLGTIVFASPFLATVPGTDTYTDQLW